MRGHKNAICDLSQKELKDVLMYNPETGEFFWRVSMPPRGKAGSKAGWNAGHYIKIAIRGQSYYAHRLAWLYMTGEWPECEIDHIDRNKLNNRWTNLREATGTQNRANQPTPKTNKFGLKGVSLHKETGKYMAKIGGRKYQKYLGLFDTPEQAHKAYLEAAKRLYGGFVLTD